MPSKKKFPSKKSSSPSPNASEKVWLYGVHAVFSALKNKNRTSERLLLLKKNASEYLAILEQECPEALSRVPYSLVEDDSFQKILPRDIPHQGIALLVSPLPSLYLETLLEKHPTGAMTILCLDHVTDPQNVGAILRSSAAFGLDAVCITERHSPPLTGALAKAASGALEITPLVLLKNLAQSLDLLKKHGFWCFGLAENSSHSLCETTFPDRTAFVLGSEGEGLRRLSREKCDVLLKIPTSPFFSTLNVSTATAVCLYENHRQKIISSSP